jgi:imidazoleglycerol-phosphate dehydratase
VVGRIWSSRPNWKIHGWEPLKQETVEDFFQGFAFTALMNLHAEILYGRNTHHKIECLFKALGRAMRAAVTINPAIQGVNSTKGVI